MTDTSRIFVSPRDLLGVELDGRYRVHSIVGGGGMGVVFRTEQTNLGRDVALKLLRFDENKSDRRLERFLREIDIISQFTHPNIVRIYDSGRDKHLGLFYIAMELIEGLPLDRILQNHTTTPEFALEVAYQTLAALTEPHAAGIIHRDIKPANLLLKAMSDDTIQVKVVDFGIARAANPADEKITTTGVVVGTPAYMAPELAVAGDVDARSDLYSIGVLIYEMLSGERPFTGDTPVAILLRHAVDSPPSLASVIDDFEYPEIVELVDWLLCKEPDARPADARVVRTEIDRIRKKYGFQRPTIEPNELPFVALDPYLIDRPEGSLGTRETLAEADSDLVTDPFGATTTWSTIDQEAAESVETGGWLVSQDALEKVPRFDLTTGEIISMPQTPVETLVTPAAELETGGRDGADADTSENLPVSTHDDGTEPHRSRQRQASPGGLPVVAIAAAIVVVIGLAVWGYTLLSGDAAVAKVVDAGTPELQTGPSDDSTDEAPDDVEQIANDLDAGGTDTDNEAAGFDLTVDGGDEAEEPSEGAEDKPAEKAGDSSPKKVTRKPSDRPSGDPAGDEAANPDAGDSVPGLKWLKEK